MNENLTPDTDEIDWVVGLIKKQPAYPGDIRGSFPGVDLVNLITTSRNHNTVEKVNMLRYVYQLLDACN